MPLLREGCRSSLDMSRGSTTADGFHYRGPIFTLGRYNFSNARPNEHQLSGVRSDLPPYHYVAIGHLYKESKVMPDPEGGDWC